MSQHFFQTARFNGTNKTAELKNRQDSKLKKIRRDAAKQSRRKTELMKTDNSIAGISPAKIKRFQTLHRNILDNAPVLKLAVKNGAIPKDDFVTQKTFAEFCRAERLDTGTNKDEIAALRHLFAAGAILTRDGVRRLSQSKAYGN